MGRKAKSEKDRCQPMSISITPDIFESFEIERKNMNMTRSEFVKYLFAEWSYQRWTTEIREAQKKATP